jgi:hypothetical protein
MQFVIITPADVSYYKCRDEDEEAWDRAEDYWRQTRRFIRPEVQPFQIYQATPSDFDDDGSDESVEHVVLSGKQLQVIVKIESIHLTPEEPEYQGESWHVEGNN